MLYALVIACEVAFWVLVLAGLAVRYLARRPRAGAVLLAAAPAVDLVLVAVVTLDLRAGAVATTGHALAAVYVGVSVGFGSAMVRWADERFAHRFADGPAPTPRPRSGPPHAARERRALARHAVAFTVGAALLGGAILLVGDPGRTEAFARLLGLWTVVLAVDVVWSLSYTVRPRRA